MPHILKFIVLANLFAWDVALFIAIRKGLQARVSNLVIGWQPDAHRRAAIVAYVLLCCAVANVGLLLYVSPPKPTGELHHAVHVVHVFFAVTVFIVMTAMLRWNGRVAPKTHRILKWGVLVGAVMVNLTSPWLVWKL